MIRLFVGIGLPEDIRARLAGLAAGIQGARWVAPENFHLTLRFVGDVNEALANDVHDALGLVRARPFEMMLSGVGHFETGGEVRALWAGVEKNPDLIALRDRIERALARIGSAQEGGLAPEGRRFMAHVTLCRLRDSPLARVSAFLGSHAMFRAGPLPVDRFTLYSSLTQDGGSVYREEARYPLMSPGERLVGAVT